MRNYKLDTTLLPKVWVTWETKNGQHYYLNCQTGRKRTTPEDWMGNRSRRYSVSGSDTPLGISWCTRDKDKVWVKSGSTVRFAYAKYHADIDRLEIAAVEMPTTRKEEPHLWKFAGERFYIGRDKTIINQQGNSEMRELYRYHTPYNNIDLIRTLLRLTANKKFTEEFKKFIGGETFLIGNGSTEHISYPWSLQRWYQTSQKAKGKGKQQQLTDELTAIELSDIAGLAEKYSVVEYSSGRYSTYTVRNLVYFEKINDDWSVLRGIHRNYDNTLNEAWRAYIGNNGVVRLVSKGKDGWVPSRQTIHRWGSYTRLVNKEEAISQCNRIKYVIESKEVEEFKLVDFLITALRFPEIEQLIKLGYAEKLSNIGSSFTPKGDLKNLFGGYYKEKESNLYRKFGLNKYQLKAYLSQEYDYCNQDSLQYMRETFGQDLSYMDNDSFDKYYAAHKAIRRLYWRGMQYLTDGLGIDYMRFFKKMVRLAQRNTNVYQVMHDTLDAYSSLERGTHPEVDWYFDDYSDLVRTHDAINELKRIQWEERRAMWDADAAERRKKEEEKRIKIDEERKKYEYEDDEYIIRLPKNSEEIIQEGSKQHICIGGYTSRHALGETNLFFLRKKSDEDIPFYAIEMNNNDSIVQIHGFGNKWLGNDPDAIPTVIRWLRKNGIQCDNKKLTCKAKGYSSCSDCVPMPVVD